jgi:hypothetical protein
MLVIEEEGKQIPEKGNEAAAWWCLEANCARISDLEEVFIGASVLVT